MEGGLAGAASGASDMVDDSDAAMQRGTAASDLRVRKHNSLCVCVRVCVGVQFSSAVNASDPHSPKSHRTTCNTQTHKPMSSSHWHP